ncbi:MAG: hypothetical protein WA010_04560 [Sulfuricurvum sp.]|jgi:hypothetical protein
MEKIQLFESKKYVKSQSASNCSHLKVVIGELSEKIGQLKNISK